MMMQQQQQPAPAAASIFNPAAAMATMAATAVSQQQGADIMYDAVHLWGKDFFDKSAARMIPGLESTMKSLRYYFAVDNKYVVVKMKKLLIPFFCKQWKRLVRALYECPSTLMRIYLAA